MWPDRISNPGPLTYESGALPTALRGPAILIVRRRFYLNIFSFNISIHSYLKTRKRVMGKQCRPRSDAT